MEHEELVEAAKKALTAVFSDTSVGRGQTREDLEDLKGEIDTMFDTLRE